MSRDRKILFVCMGNICRSPAAEAVLRALAAERGLSDRIEVDSAGTTDYHAGEPRDARMRAAGVTRGYRIDGVARQVQPEDFDRFDLVVAMDRDNLAAMTPLAAGRRTRPTLFSAFLPSGTPVDVPDPYFGGAKGFETVLDLLEAGCPSLLDHTLELPARGQDGAG